MRILRRLVLRLEDFARTRRLSRIKAVGQQLYARLFKREAIVAVNAQYLSSWHPVNRQSHITRRTIALAQRSGRGTADSVELRRSIVLKRYVSPRERGILLISFESELSKLARLRALPQLESRYAIVFLPTWQPFYSEPIFQFAARAQRPYWVMPSSSADRPLCANLGPLCRPLPFQASSWVSEHAYTDVARSKSIDFLMLANFSKYKRHWRLFEALREMPASVTTVLAGVPIGNRTLHSLRLEADAFGVTERIDFRETPSDDQVAALLGSARVFCALSHKEGSYIAISEALMAGTPVAIFEDAIVGSKEFIGPETGWLLNPRKPLSSQLLTCLSNAPNLHPRDWARRCISAEVNVPRLNELMRIDAKGLGEEWSNDLKSFYCRHFEFEYSNGYDELNLVPEYQSLEAQFGVHIPRPIDGIRRESSLKQNLDRSGSTGLHSQ